MEYNADKKDLDNKNEDVENKIPDVCGLFTNAAFNTKIGEVQNKILIASGLVTNAAFNTKIGEVEKKS